MVVVIVAWTIIPIAIVCSAYATSRMVRRYGPTPVHWCAWWRFYRRTRHLTRPIPVAMPPPLPKKRKVYVCPTCLGNKVKRRGPPEDMRFRDSRYTLVCECGWKEEWVYENGYDAHPLWEFSVYPYGSGEIPTKPKTKHLSDYVMTERSWAEARLAKDWEDRFAGTAPDPVLPTNFAQRGV